MTHCQIIRSFIDTIMLNDKQAILNAFCIDASFHNIPMDIAIGHEQIWAVLATVHESCTDIDWIIHFIAEDEHGNVLTERTDRYKINGQWVEFKVMGIFELSAGKIKHWRDYFDLQQSLDQMAKAN